MAQPTQKDKDQRYAPYAGGGGHSTSTVFSGCKVTNTLGQSIPGNGTETALTFDTESYDTDGYHSTLSATSRLAVPSDGKYLLNATVDFPSNNTGSRSILFKLGGSITLNYDKRAAVASDRTLMTCAFVTEATAGQYFEVYVAQNSGSALVLDVDVFKTTFSITKLG